MIVDEKIEQYAAAHTTPVDPFFERLAAETREKMTAPQMMVGLLEGRFLEFLVRLSGARMVVELGTFTGWSSISMASGLPPGGRVVTCDVNPEAQEIARRYADEAGVADRIDCRPGPGVETVDTLEAPFEPALIAPDEPNHRTYYAAVLQKLGEDGLIVVANVLRPPRVVEERHA